MRKTAFVVVLAVAVCLASAAVAQTVIETKVKSGTVIGKTDHSVVIKMDDGIVREFEVPAGRTATVDGKEVGLSGIKIGTTLSVTFKTVTKPVEVKTVTIKDGEVVKVAGASLTTKEKDGFHSYIVPQGFKFLVNGKETGIESLSPGMKLNATIVTTSAAMTTETTRGGATGKAPLEPTAVMVAAAPPAPAPTQAPAPEKAAPAAPKAAAAAPATAPESATAPPAPAPTAAPAPATTTPAPEPPAGSSRTTTIVIGLIVLLLLIVLVILGTKKQE